MSKAVMISIRPRWCELIANGKKTIEVRKTRPKLETPFKVYVYCSKPRFEHEDFFALVGKQSFHGGGKVIGEFVCDTIAQLVPGVREPAEYRIVDDRGWAYPIELMLEEALVTAESLFVYLDGENGAAWHISDLKIYDKPKEISEFKKHSRECYFDNLGMATPKCSECTQCNLTRPPQSYCFVEALQT